MSYTSILQDLPPELQLTLFKLVEALEQNIRAQFAVRREDFLNLSAQVNGLLEAQQASVQRIDRLENVLLGLAEAQNRTEQRVGELAQAQNRTEQRVEELAQAQNRTEQRVGELAEAQNRTEQRVEELAEAQNRTEQRVEELAEAQNRTEQRVGELAEAQNRTEQRVEELAEAQNRTEQRVEELAQAQNRTEQRVGELAQAQNRTEQRVGELAEVQRRSELQLIELVQSNKENRNELSKVRGERLERQYRERGFAYLGQILRRVQPVSLQEILNHLEKHLTDEEITDLLPLDLLMQGQAFQVPNKPTIWLALEISGVVDRNDVERVLRRTALLRKAGYMTIPTVAGEKVTEGGEALARSSHVFVLQNGHKLFWEEALATALGSADI